MKKISSKQKQNDEIVEKSKSHTEKNNFFFENSIVYRISYIVYGRIFLKRIFVETRVLTENEELRFF